MSDQSAAGASVGESRPEPVPVSRQSGSRILDLPIDDVPRLAFSDVLFLRRACSRSCRDPTISRSRRSAALCRSRLQASAASSHPVSRLPARSQPAKLKSQNLKTKNHQNNRRVKTSNLMLMLISHVEYEYQYLLRQRLGQLK